jgi:FkbM family methyltransferase
VAATIEHNRVAFGYEFRSVIDVGAHQGQFSLFASERFGGALLWAIEPLAGPRKRLGRVLEATAGVRIIPAAASRARGAAQFYVSRSSDSSSLLPMTKIQTRAFPGTGTQSVIQVETAPLDDLLGGAIPPRPCLLKIDVQGAELDVLAGAEMTLKRVDEVLVECSFVELYQGQALASEVVAHLHARGFGLTGIHSVVRNDVDGTCLQADFLFSSIHADR